MQRSRRLGSVSTISTDTLFLDDDGASLPHNWKRTVVSVVLGRKAQKDVAYRKSNGYDRLDLLASLYSVALILAGSTLYVTNAIRGQFGVDIVGIYQFYLLFVSAVFLIYLQVYHLRKKPTAQIPEQRRGRANTGAIILEHVHANHVTSAESSPASSRRGMSSRSSQVNFDADLQYDSDDEMFEDKPIRPINGRVFKVSECHTDVTDTGWESVGDNELLHRHVISASQSASLANEGSSFYLRLGVVLFGACNIIYVILQIEDLLGGHVPEEDMYQQDAWPLFFHLIFLLVQTFFLFKNSQLYVTRHKAFVRFGCLHVMSANFCIWLRIQTRDTLIHFKQDAENNTDPNTVHDSAFMTSFPYLFPCVMEYSILCMAIMYAMASSVYIKCTASLLKKLRCHVKRLCSTDGAHNQNGGRSTTGMDFDKSHRGLFAGVVFFACILVTSLLITFTDKDGSREQAVWLYTVSQFTFDATITAAIALSIFQMRNMSRFVQRIISIDYWLLTVSMGGIILLQTFIIISNAYSIGAVTSVNTKYTLIVQIAAALLKVIKCIMQTGFMLNGLQKYCCTEELRRQKPGRASVTFLLIANLGIWIFHTFSYRKFEQEIHEQFYGEVTWHFCQGMSYPLKLFFYFHSTVCLADMWITSYGKGLTL